MLWGRDRLPAVHGRWRPSNESGYCSSIFSTWSITGSYCPAWLAQMGCRLTCSTEYHMLVAKITFRATGRPMSCRPRGQSRGDSDGSDDSDAECRHVCLL
jgi:hypothetical protein